MKLSGKSIYFPGVDRSKILAAPRIDFRKELNIESDRILLLSIGELNCNKNHKSVIEALSTLKNNNYVYVICGDEELKKYYLNLIKKIKNGRKSYIYWF